MLGFFFIYSIIFIAFFGNSIEIVGFPSILNWLSELFLYFFFWVTLVASKRHLQFPYAILFLLFSITGLASGVLNHNLNFEFLNSMRLVLRYYLFFIAVVNLNLSEKHLKQINKVIIICFLIQLPVAFIKFAMWGQTEQTIGTYSLSDGSASTYIPLIMIGYLLGFYFFYKTKLIYILLIPLCIGYALVAEKRGIVYFLPIVVTFITFILLINFGQIKKKIPNLSFKLIAIFCFVIFLSVGMGVKTLKGLNPEGQYGGSMSTSYLIDHAIKYETSTREKSGATGGRLGTTNLVFKTLFQKGYAKALFGYGPGSYFKSRFHSEIGNTINEVYRDMNIDYGETPLSLTAIQSGCIGVSIYLSFMFIAFLKTYRAFKDEIDSHYWKALTFGNLIFMFVYMLIWLSYSNSLFIGDLIPLIFFYMLSLVEIKIWKNP